MKIGAILQARTSSTRLPFKVLKELPFKSGITALEQIIRRLKRSQKLNAIIVATTQEASDDAIAKIAEKENVGVFRGSLTDVLERYYLAAKENSLDVIVRITGDCPCIDPSIVDLVIDTHLKEKSDYTSNAVKRSYPDGLDVEVFSFKLLQEAYHQATHPNEREHVTLYMYQRPGDFKVVHVEASKEFYAPERRITLDTPQDYALLCFVYDALYPDDQYFNAKSIMKLFEEKPWLDWINVPDLSKKYIG